MVLSLISFVAAAQQSSSEAIIEAINLKSSQMKSLQCEFVQTKHLSILNDKMVSYGKMYFEQPGKLRWEYTKPYTYIFIMNSDQVMLKNDSRTDVIDIKQNRTFREIANIMMNSISGKCLSDTKAFKITIAETPQEWTATLIPQKRDMKMMWSRLVLHFDRAKRMVSVVEMHEPTGDSTIIKLSESVENKDIDEHIFSIK